VLAFTLPESSWAGWVGDDPGIPHWNSATCRHVGAPASRESRTADRSPSAPSPAKPPRRESGARSTKAESRR
jgi:hypothetical protein